MDGWTLWAWLWQSGAWAPLAVGVVGMALAAAAGDEPARAAAPPRPARRPGYPDYAAWRRDVLDPRVSVEAVLARSGGRVPERPAPREARRDARREPVFERSVTSPWTFTFFEDPKSDVAGPWQPLKVVGRGETPRRRTIYVGTSLKTTPRKET